MVEKGALAKGRFHVGVALEDTDGDGRLEGVMSHGWNDSSYVNLWAAEGGSSD